MRLGVRLSAAVVVVVLPVSMAGLAPQVVSTAHESSPRAALSAPFDLAALQRGYVSVLTLDPPQEVEPQTVIRGGLALGTSKERNRRISVESARGGKVFKASSLLDNDLPSAAMRAYRRAAGTLAKNDPGCRLPWTLLAGIGRVESDHGRYGGSVLGSDGVPRPAIVGVALNGKGPVAAIRDSDRGAFDGDKVWDRAVGPMQFIPTTWRSAGRDGDGDGRSTPNDIDDAALAAAGYLCSGGRDLSTDSGRASAIFSYNPSDYYVDLVSAFERGYRTGTFVIPSPDVPAGAGDGVVPVADGGTAQKTAQKKAQKQAQKKAQQVARKQAQKKAQQVAQQRAQQAARIEAARQARAQAAARAKAAARPTPRPAAPKPTPTPSAPVVRTVQGVVTVSGAGWEIGGQRLAPGDLGPIGARDYDGDGAVESAAEELTGLAETGGRAAMSFTGNPFRITGFSRA